MSSLFTIFTIGLSVFRAGLPKRALTHLFSLLLLLIGVTVTERAQTAAAATALTPVNETAVAKVAYDATADAQLWPDMQLNLRLKPSFALVGFGTVRWGRDFSTLVTKQLGGGINWTVRPKFSFATQLRRVITDPLPGRHSVETRLHFDFTPRGKLGKGFQYTNRIRLEWRWINGVLSNRYRDRVQLERPFQLKLDHHKEPLRLTPYVSYELYYDTRVKAFSRQQVYLGSRVPLIKHVTFNGFYMHQFDNNARPGNVNVLGTFLQFEF